MKNIANDNLIKEVKFRLNNIKVDSLLSTGELEQLIEDNERPEIPTLIQTERPDKCSKYLMQGRVVIIVNGNPYALIVPAISTVRVTKLRIKVSTAFVFILAISLIGRKAKS